MEIVLGRENAGLLSQSDLESLLDIVTRALQVNCSEELEGIWPSIAELADLDGGIFGVSKTQARENGVKFDLVTFGIDPEWLKSYSLSQLVEDDPLVQVALKLKRPISWKDAAQLAMKMDGPAFRGSEFREHARVSGLENGYIYSRRSQYVSQAIAITAVTTGSRPITKRQCQLLTILLPHLNEILIRQGFSTATELSPREREVLRWAAAGKSNWEVAQILNITERTVKFHLRNIYRKLEVNNRSHAVAEAIRLGAVDLE